MHGGGGRVYPAEFSGGGKLLRPESKDERYLGLGNLDLDVVVIRNASNLELGKIRRQSVSEPLRGDPEIQAVVRSNKNFHGKGKPMGGRGRPPTPEASTPPGQAEPGYIYGDFFSLRSVPVISFGSGIPNIPKIVGEISRNEPPGFRVNRFAFSATTTNGTGFVVCAVCGPPVAGSIIISALPWSAVISMAPPLAGTANSMRPGQASTVSMALMVGSILPEWPTMSAFAKFTINTSKVPSSTAFTTVSAIAAALRSCFRSYVATFGEGTRVRSSPGNGCSMPPLKK